MGDLTAEYFARASFIKAVKWLSKYENVDSKTVYKCLSDQEKKVAELKHKFNKIKFNSSI